MAVSVPGNPLPFAVGRADMSTPLATSTSTGRLVTILHVFGDHCWSIAGLRRAMPDGYHRRVVLAAGKAPAEGDDDDDDEEEEEGKEEEEKKEEEQKEEEKKEEEEKEEEKEEEMEEVVVVTAEEMEGLIEHCLLQVLHTRVKAEELPLMGSMLWRRMMDVRPPGSKLDMKRTRYKKFGKWIAAYHAKGLLTAREDKKSGEWYLTGVVSTHELYAAFKPVHIKATPKAPPPPSSSVPEMSGGYPRGGGGGGGSTPPMGLAPLDIVQKYTPSNAARQLFTRTGRNPKGYYDASEICAAVRAYVAQEGLDDVETRVPDPSMVFVDNLLYDVLFRGHVKKTETTPRVMKKGECMELFVKRMLLHTVIQRGHQEVVRKNQLVNIDISTEKRQGNKRVTKVVGLEEFLIDAEALSGVLAKYLAGASSVEELPGGKTGRAVIVQGEHEARLATILADRYGVPRKFIAIAGGGGKKGGKGR